MNNNESPWKVIFYEDENMEGIIDSEHYFDEPSTEDVESMMKTLESKYAQLYYDVYDTDEYDELICEYNL